MTICKSAWSAASRWPFSGKISNRPSVSKTLTVNGAGVTTLYGANTYGPSAGSVGTTLSGGGTLQVGNNSALGAGDLSVTASSTLQAGINGLNVGNNVAIGSGVTATVDNNGNNLTLGGGITGSGALVKIGNGTLTLNGNNTYSGNTTINAGALTITSPNSVANTPTIFLNGGDLLGSGTFAINNNHRHRPDDRRGRHHGVAGCRRRPDLHRERVHQFSGQHGRERFDRQQRCG